MVESPGQLRPGSSRLLSFASLILIQEKHLIAHWLLQQRGVLTKGSGLSLKTEDNLPGEETRTLVQEAPFGGGHSSLLSLDGMA